MPTGFDNVGRGRGQGRRARRGGNFGGRTRARNGNVRSEQNRLSQQLQSNDSMLEDVDSANSSTGSQKHRQIIPQIFAGIY